MVRLTHEAPYRRLCTVAGAFGLDRSTYAPGAAATRAAGISSRPAKSMAAAPTTRQVVCISRQPMIIGGPLPIGCSVTGCTPGVRRCQWTDCRTIVALELGSDPQYRANGPVGTRHVHCTSPLESECRTSHCRRCSDDRAHTRPVHAVVVDLRRDQCRVEPGDAARRPPTRAPRVRRRPKSRCRNRR